MSENPKSNGSSHSHYYDVGEFHHKFGLPNFYRTGDAPQLINDPALQEFRIKFMEEELREYKEAVAVGDLAKAADALVDLIYVALGTAHYHMLPWQSLWDEVQRANMTKERCEIDHPYIPDREDIRAPRCKYCDAPQHKHSLRGHINDVIKPPGWRPPEIERILEEYGCSVKS